MTTAHRFFVAVSQIDGERVAFNQHQAHQIRNVLRLRSGDQVRVFDGITPRDRVVELADASWGRITGESAQAAEPKTRLVAYPALLHRDKFETVLQKLTEVGVAAIVPVITARGLVREPPDERRMERWQAILREAAEQSGRGVVPELEHARSFAQAIDSAAGLRVMAYEGEPRCGLREALIPEPNAVSIFIGPEGGFSPEEAQHAQTGGARLITLGSRILRAETASPLLAALVLYELEQRA